VRTMTVDSTGESVGRTVSPPGARDGDASRLHPANQLVVSDESLVWLATDVDAATGATTRRLVINAIDVTTGKNTRTTDGVTVTLSGSGSTVSISGVSSHATAPVITATGHGLTTGETVTISGVGGATAVNITCTVTRLTDDTFSILTPAADTSAQTYTSGGSVAVRSNTVTTTNGNIVPQWVTDGNTLTKGLTTYSIHSRTSDSVFVTDLDGPGAGAAVITSSTGSSANQKRLQRAFKSTLDSIAVADGSVTADDFFHVYDIVSDGGTGVFAAVQKVVKEGSNPPQYTNQLYSFRPRPPSEEQPIVSGIDPTGTNRSTVVIKQDAATISGTASSSGAVITFDAEIPKWVDYDTRISDGTTVYTVVTRDSDTAVTVTPTPSSALSGTSLVIAKNICRPRSIAYDSSQKHLAVVGKNPMGVGGDAHTSTVNSLVVYNVAAVPTNTASDHAADIKHLSQPSNGGTVGSVAVDQWDRIVATAVSKKYRVSRNASGVNIQEITLTTGASTNDEIQYDWSVDANQDDQDHDLPANINNQGATDINRIRDVRLISVAGGLVRKIDPIHKAVTEVGGQIAGPQLSVLRPQLFAAISYPNVFFADADNARYYDTAVDELKDWNAAVTGSGNTLPSSSGRYCRLICEWSGRIVLARLESEPQNWFMSALNDPFDWNFGGGLETSAVAGSTLAGVVQPAGKTPDIVNCLVPWTNDVLLFGLDHSITALSGNPAGGGRFDTVTSITGMAFGRPFAFHPDRSLWFIGARGGLYRMSGPSSSPERISSNTVDDRLTDIDFSKAVVRMAWDDRMQGFLLFFTSIEGGAENQHYFYDVRTQGWFPWSFDDPNHDPYVLHSFDGDDPADRTVLFGCPDGHVRHLDYTGASDDGTGIKSHVLIGPVSGPEGIPVVMTGLTALLSGTSSNVTYTIHPGDSAEEASAAPSIGGGTFTAGRNTWDRRRTSGASIYIKLSNVTDGQTWAIERLTASLRPTGRTFEKAH
jgi:hypothetical protein